MKFDIFDSFGDLIGSFGEHEDFDFDFMGGFFSVAFKIILLVFLIGSPYLIYSFVTNSLEEGQIYNVYAVIGIVLFGIICNFIIKYLNENKEFDISHFKATMVILCVCCSIIGIIEFFAGEFSFLFEQDMSIWLIIFSILLGFLFVAYMSFAMTIIIIIAYFITLLLVFIVGKIVKFIIKIIRYIQFKNKLVKSKVYKKVIELLNEYGNEVTYVDIFSIALYVHFLNKETEKILYSDCGYSNIDEVEEYLFAKKLKKDTNLSVMEKSDCGVNVYYKDAYKQKKELIKNQKKAEKKEKHDKAKSEKIKNKKPKKIKNTNDWK